MEKLPITAAGHASWALGVAKSMLDDVAELSVTKARMSDMEPLARRPTFPIWRLSWANRCRPFSDSA